MKFPPKSRKQSQIPRLSSFDDPHPHSSPKVIVPKQISDTRKPLRPSNWYRIASSVNNNERQRTSMKNRGVDVHCRSSVFTVVRCTATDLGPEATSPDREL